MTNAIAGEGMRRGVKPVAPPDLWEKLDAARNAVLVIDQPPGTFTSEQYASRYKVAQRTACQHLLALRKAGKVEKVGLRFYRYRG